MIPESLPGRGKLSRSTAYSPESAQWTLYDPAPLAKILGTKIEDTDRALEKTGFNKAVRIREHLIRWKESLRKRDSDLCREIDRLNKELASLKNERKIVFTTLEQVRNILRIEREKP